MFRISLKQGRGEELTHEEGEILKFTENNGLLQCKSCKRTFNSKAIEAHQKSCTEKTKLENLIKKSTRRSSNYK
jgi:hypothetical protein